MQFVGMIRPSAPIRNELDILYSISEQTNEHPAKRTRCPQPASIQVENLLDAEGYEMASVQYGAFTCRSA